MAEIASEVRLGLETLAGAICFAAAAEFADDYNDQIEQAAAAIEACKNGFAGIDVSDLAGKAVCEFLGNLNRKDLPKGKAR